MTDITSKMLKCEHCGTHIDKTKLIGLAIVCHSCNKPHNGNLINLR